MDNESMSNQPKRTAEFIVSIILTVIGILSFLYAMFIYVTILDLINNPEANSSGQALGLIALIPLYFIVIGASSVPTIISFIISIYNLIKKGQKWGKVILIINAVVLVLLLLSIIILFASGGSQGGTSTSASISIA